MNALLLLTAASILLLTHTSQASVRNLRKKFAVAYTIEENNFVLGLSSTENPAAREIRFRPNTLPLNGVQVTAYGLTLAYKKDVSRNPTEDARKGKTSYEDIRGALNLGEKDQWLLVGYYNRYGGLYIENSSDVDPSYFGQTSFIQRSDISIFNSGFAAIYVWDPDKFSLPAAVMQSARQVESAGSLLIMAGFDGTLFTSDQSLLPASIQSAYGKDAPMSAGQFSTASISAGYGYTLTKASFFLTAIVMAGPGTQWRRYTVNGVESTSTVNAAKLTVGASTGYNGESFFTGLSYVMNSTEYATESIRIRTQLISLRAFLGVRF